MMREFQRPDDMPLATYRSKMDELWGEFARTYEAWSANQKDPHANYSLKQVLWERYVMARDSYLSRPRRVFD